MSSGAFDHGVFDHGVFDHGVFDHGALDHGALDHGALDHGARGQGDPFEVLGLRADDEVTDDEVRAAWRRIASATHPDRADGGDPDRFALAAAAFTELRTSFGRGEARAAAAAGDRQTPATELTSGARPRGLRHRGLRHRGRRHRYLFGSRIRHGRPVRLVLRLAVAVATGAVGVVTAGPGTAAAPALAVGALTWFLLTARGDLGPP